MSNGEDARDVRLAKRYNAGASIAQLAKLEHVAPVAMRARLLATGLVTIRPQHPWKKL